MILKYKSSYKSESKSVSITVEKSYNKTAIDFNFGRYMDLSAFKSNIHLSLVASVKITFSGR